jgi:hypothetical protein
VLKQSVSIFLLTVLVLPLLLKLAVVINYAVEYEYYVKVLCENRDKPELRCNGTCHLSKELRAAEDPATPPEIPGIAKIEIQPFLSRTLAAQAVIVLERSQTLASFQVSLWENPFLAISLPPPRRG